MHILFLFTEPDAHIDSRNCNYRDSHNVASRYAASVIASPVATWQQRSLAMATARCAAFGPTSPTIRTSEYLWDGTDSLQSEDAGWSILSPQQWQLSVLKAPSWALIYPPVRKCPTRAAVWKTRFLKKLPVSVIGKHVTSFDSKGDLVQFGHLALELEYDPDSCTNTQWWSHTLLFPCVPQNHSKIVSLEKEGNKPSCLFLSSSLMHIWVKTGSSTASEGFGPLLEGA